MDWGYVGKYEVDGQLKDVYAFVMVLGYSRMKYIEFTTSMDLESLMKCHMNAFAYFNGVPEQILYDNMKTDVIRHTPDEYECIAKHPLLTGQLRYHAKLEHYKGLNVTTTSGLATCHTQPDALEVERRSLQVYEQLEGSES